MTETELYHAIHLELKALCKLNNVPLHYVRIESPIQQGIPDINVCIKGHEFWIECKVNEFELSPMQISWQAKRIHSGGKVFNIDCVANVFKLFLYDGTILKMGKELDDIICHLILKLMMGEKNG